MLQKQFYLTKTILFICINFRKNLVSVKKMITEMKH